MYVTAQILQAAIYECISHARKKEKKSIDYKSTSKYTFINKSFVAMCLYEGHKSQKHL